MKKKETEMKTNGFPVIQAKLFAHKAAEYESEIRVVWEEKNIISDGKSILGLMAMEVKQGTRIVLTAEGTDEDRAAEELVNWLETYPG
ncbi:HPr family phosphocarrier protein [Paenibacillus chitinolyticus]|uniref:HPr family phosphocarrier protein n=1 Tax=Paenibacillus chitinolyticus TaxID=79263 RepID=UPI0035DF0928